MIKSEGGGRLFMQFYRKGESLDGSFISWEKKDRKDHYISIFVDETADEFLIQMLPIA